MLLRITEGLGFLFIAVVFCSCFYAKEINRAPEAKVTVITAAPFYINGEISLTAKDSTDPDGDTLREIAGVTWRVFKCDDRAGTTCESTPFKELSLSLGTDFDFIMPNKYSVRVVVEVRDVFGATGGTALRIEANNRPPVIERLTVVGELDRDLEDYIPGFLVTSTVNATEDDGDELTYRWWVDGPGGKVEMPSKEGAPHIMEFSPTTGEWEVSVTVYDDEDDTDEADKAFVVGDDKAACIVSSRPLAMEEIEYQVVDGESKRFSVLQVVDELDGFPRKWGNEIFGQPSFHWSVKSPWTNNVFESITGTVNSFFLLHTLGMTVGDDVYVRVDVSDRSHGVLECGTPFCNDGGCLRRLTWKVVIR